MHWSRRFFFAGLWFCALLLSNLLILVADSLLLKAAGSLLVTAVLPGLAALKALFPHEQELDPWERVGLGFSLGLFGTMQLVWGYMLAPGRMQMPVLLALLDVLSLVLALAAWRRTGRPAVPRAKRRFNRETALALGLLAATVLLLGLNLGSAEYDHDETPVVSSAVASILGSDGTIFSLRKGPAQIVTATTFILLGGNLSEGFVRIPFAMAGLATALVLWRLARRLLGRTAALAALALWLTEGTHLGEARWVQYQILVVLTALCAVFCFVRAVRTHGSARTRFQLLGAFFFAAGLFAHYDGVFVAPLLGVLWLWMRRDRLRNWRIWAQAAGPAALIALVAAPFYVALSQQGDAAAYFDRYFFGLRVGRGPFNMMPSFAERLAVLDSPAWLLAVASGSVLAGVFIGARLWRRNRLSGVFWYALLAGAFAAALFPDALVVGGQNLSFVPYTAMLLLLIILPTGGLTIRILSIWTLSAWLFPAFWMQVPGDHYFAALPALTLLVVWSWAQAAIWLAELLPARAVRAAGTVAVAVACITGGGYVYAMLVSSAPEYAMRYPEIAAWPLALFKGERPALLYGTYPHQSGWRAVAVLVNRGILRGEYESNEMHAIADWYLAINWWPPQTRPRYYLQVVWPFAPILASEVPQNLAETHWLIGQITVAGEPHMLIYQRREAGDAPPIQVWPVESLDAEWQRLAVLERFNSYREQGRDDSAFYEVARRLEAEGRAGDAVLVDSALGRPLLARFYGGNLPLVTSLNDPAAKQAQRILGVYWGSPDRTGERAVAASKCPATARWFKNVRLTVNGAGEYARATPVNATLGDVGRLRSVSFNAPVSRGSILCVRLDWELLGATGAPHKLFLHLVGSDGKVAAQSDWEPLAGFRPTTEWSAGESFIDNAGVALPPELAAGSYRVLVGLYDGSSGIRLPAVNAAGVRFANDAVEVGRITIP